MNSTENVSNDITKIIGKKFLINEWRDTTLPRVSGIYKIVNRVNGKYYVGSSKNIFTRWNTHLRELKNGIHHSDYLQRAWLKYKADNFTFEVVEMLNTDKLKEAEQVYLNKAFVCENAEFTYNASPNAVGGSCLPEIVDKIKSCWTNEKRKLHGDKYLGNKNHFYGKTHSDETKRKLSEKHIGKVLTTQHCENIKLSHLGEKNSFYGKTHSDETKRKISDHLKNKYLGKENPNADLRVYHFINDITLESFTGTRYDFCKKFNLNRSTAAGLIYGKVKKTRSGWIINPPISSPIQPSYPLE